MSGDRYGCPNLLPKIYNNLNSTEHQNTLVSERGWVEPPDVHDVAPQQLPFLHEVALRDVKQALHGVSDITQYKLPTLWVPT